MLIAGIVLIVLGIIFWFLGKKKKSTSDEMTKTKSVPIGQLIAGAQQEAQGTVACAQPLQTPFTKQPCVYYSYEVEREVRTQNPQGQPATRWERVDSNASSIPFQITDASGSITVNPEHASIEGRDMGEQWIEQNNLASFGMLRITTASFMGGSLRAKEKALLVGGNAYVFGLVNQGSQGLEFQKGNESFVISYKTEEEVEKSTKRSAMLMKVFSVIGVVAGVALAVYSFMK